MKLSPLASPPIQTHEIEQAPTAICVNHNGLIRHTGDREGRVFYCPIGKEFWRYAKSFQGINTPLRYAAESVL